MGHLADFGSFAAPDKGTGIDCLQLLLNLPGDGCAGTFRQCTKFGERIRRSDTVRGARFDANQNSTFGLFY
jgi:hypothetical protein